MTSHIVDKNKDETYEEQEELPEDGLEELEEVREASAEGKNESNNS